MDFQGLIEVVGRFVDGVGVAVIVIGIAVASYRYLAGGPRSPDGYVRYRQDLGRGILLGLEILVAADIIRTVGVEPTLNGVFILGLIVLIRTFLSTALQVELEGRLSWQPKK